MLNEKINEILRKEGAATFATAGTDGPHLAATWNSYITVLETDELLIPVGGLHETEENIKRHNNIQMIVASKEVYGTHGPGAGYVLKGPVKFESLGGYFDQVKANFPWARAVMIFQPVDVKQLI